LEQVESLINAVDVEEVMAAAAAVCHEKAFGFRRVAGENAIAGLNAAAWKRQAKIIERTATNLRGSPVSGAVPSYPQKFALLEQVKSLIDAVDVANLLLAVVAVCNKHAATKQGEIVERTVRKLEEENLA
jgi:hypothetical protein